MTRFSRKHIYLTGGIALAAAVLFYAWEFNVFTTLAVSSALLIFALGRKKGFLSNRVMVFISSISMEIYLSHMLIYRAAEMGGFTAFFGNGWIQYLFTVMIVFLGAVVFSYSWKMAVRFGENFCIGNFAIGRFDCENPVHQ